MPISVITEVRWKAETSTNLLRIGSTIRSRWGSANSSEIDQFDVTNILVCYKGTVPPFISPVQIYLSPHILSRWPKQALSRSSIRTVSYPLYPSHHLD